MANQIKILREKQGLTQRQLAEFTKLSLRTIQRVEASEHLPKGHTLKCLEAFFNHKFKKESLLLDENSLTRIKLINFSSLLFLFLPLLHTCLPIILWKRHSNSPSVDNVIRQLISFQLQWTFIYVLLIVSAAILQGKLNLDIPVVLFVMLALIVANAVVVFHSANTLTKKGKLPSYLLSQIQLI